MCYCLLALLFLTLLHLITTMYHSYWHLPFFSKNTKFAATIQNLPGRQLRHSNKFHMVACLNSHFRMRWDPLQSQDLEKRTIKTYLGLPETTHQRKAPEKSCGDIQIGTRLRLQAFTFYVGKVACLDLARHSYADRFLASCSCTISSIARRHFPSVCLRNFWNGLHDVHLVCTRSWGVALDLKELTGLTRPYVWSSYHTSNSVIDPVLGESW